MTTTQWADLVLGVHLGYAGFVAFGFAAILIGWPLHWRWIRTGWFPVTHLAAIAIVASMALLSLPCPLTVMEYNLRGFTGDAVEEHFIGRLISGWLNFEIQNWVFTTAYVALTALAIAFRWAVSIQGNMIPKPKIHAHFSGFDKKRYLGRERE